MPGLRGLAEIELGERVSLHLDAESTDPNERRRLAYLKAKGAVAMGWASGVVVIAPRDPVKQAAILARHAGGH